MDKVEQLFISQAKAAKMLVCSDKVIRDLVKRKIIGHKKGPGGGRLVYIEDIKDLARTISNPKFPLNIKPENRRLFLNHFGTGLHSVSL